MRNEHRVHMGLEVSFRLSPLPATPALSSFSRSLSSHVSPRHF